jgi:ElaB/YqjD/DUF883 family membrane-anchored ribosome-binding protein
MDDGMERVRDDMDETRARLADTAAQLGDAIGDRTDAVRERVGAVKERLDVGQLVQQHPWPALGLAVGLGVALAASGADRRVVSATTSTARRASRSATDAVRRRRERAQAMQQLRSEDEPVTRGGLVERLTRAILQGLNVDQLVAGIRHAGAEMGHARPAADVSTNRLAQNDYWKGNGG